jgi:hypothetical protein
LVRASGLGLTSGHDQTLYLVVNNFGNLGTAFAETDLGDAAEYITELPKAQHDADEWQAAMQALLLVAEQDGPVMFARTGVMKALNRNFERTLTGRKEMHWGKRKLKLKRDE